MKGNSSHIPSAQNVVETQCVYLRYSYLLYPILSKTAIKLVMSDLAEIQSNIHEIS